jgi:hypothetical protein
MSIIATGVAGVGFFIASALGGVRLSNTMNPLASVADNGRHVIVTGPLTCIAGEKVFMRVTVSQRETGAIAEGRTMVNCTGVLQQWEVHAATQGNERFGEGAAIGTALARTNNVGDNDAHQWLVALTLVKQ